MTRTTWIIGLVLAVAAVVQLTLMATGVAGIPPDDRGKPSGAPASVQLTPDPAIIECNGIDAATVTVRVTDALGRSVADGTLVHFDAQYGFVDPVEATTRRGEASTQASLYEYARSFAGQTGVDVFVDGGLRASIGIDCAPEGPPCDPATPPTHPQSPPCPTPGPCNFPFSPPVHSQSPPCTDPEPCNFPFSPPLHVMSPPCGTPTPEPCPPASPPCRGQSEMKVDLEPETPGVQFRAPKPIGTPFRVGVNVTFASEPYAQYGWVIEWPNAGLRFDDAIFEVGPALGMERCSAVGVFPAPIDPAYDSAVFGTCGTFRAGFGTDYVGEITQFTFSCVAPGFHMISLVGRNSSAGVVALSSPATPFSTLLRSGGGLIETTTEGAVVFCEEEAPPIGFGTIRFESYEPVTATVGVPFELSIEAVDVSIPYQGYQWLAGTSAGLRVTTEVPAQSLFDLCTGDPDEVAPNEFYGGCIRLGASIPSAYVGRLATLMLVCASPGDKQVRLSSNPPFGTALLTDQGSEFGGPDTSVIDVTCAEGAPTATPSPSESSRGNINLGTPTPAPAQRGQRGLQ